MTAFFALYYIVPFKLKNYCLLFFSLLFYAWGEPIYVFLMMFSAGVDWLDGLFLEKHPKHKKLYLTIAIVINLGLLCFFKYTNFLMGVLGSIFKISVPAVNVTLPIGISFYTFQSMSYSLDVYRGDAKVEHNYFYYLMYVSMFPQLIAGPIVRYQTIADEIRVRDISKENFVKGVSRFLLGLFKKVLLANALGELFTQVSGEASLTAATAWLGLIGFALQIYFDFSGYSDMAIGLGSMFGFAFKENFNYPYVSTSITEFWKRWHMSLSSWFREYVYIPLGGKRKGPARQYLNLLIVWSLTGLWHGASLNFVLWGLYYAALLILEKLFFGRRPAGLPGVLRHLVTLLIVAFGWGIFYFTDMGLWSAFVGRLFAFRADTAQALRFMAAYLPIGLVACAASTGLPKRLLEKMRKSWPAFLEIPILAGLFILCTAALVSQSYNPFIYFRF